MKRIYIRHIPLAIVLALLGEVAAMAEVDAVARLASSVVFLRQPVSPTESRIGTAFFVHNAEKPFLVTAAHMAQIMTQTSSVTFRAGNDRPVTLGIPDLLGGKIPNWKFHPDADVAILQLDPATEIKEKFLKGRFLDLKMFESTRIAPGRPITITVLGFPLALGVGEVFSPISRETKAASGLLELPRADSKQMAIVYVTQDPSVGGFSGAPVFDTGLAFNTPGMMNLGAGITKVVGIVHGTISDETGGKFGVIVPSSYIVDFILKQ